MPSTPWRLRVRAILLLGIVLGTLLCAYLYQSMVVEQPRVPYIRVAELPPEPSDHGELSGVVAQVGSRPLFWQERRPVRPGEAPVAAALTVKGIEAMGAWVHIDRDARIGFLTVDGKSRRVRFGDNVKGWRVGGIESTHILLISDEGSVTLPVISRPAERLLTPAP
ncbi:MAG: hypothetical protein LPK85_03660, partial [Gammaproteobacteria bacterium]|nr:hypothetical protein [Gammaproteobacteria bacterium]